jgi:hypothetical protein
MGGPTEAEATQARDEREIRALVESIRFVTPDVAVVHLPAFHNTRVRPLDTSGPMVRLAGRFVRWRTDRARRRRR